MLYKTGDLMRRNPDGTLQFQGQADNQIKFRGYRIELDEILPAIENHDWVKAAGVTALGFGVPYTTPVDMSFLAIALMGVGIGIWFPLSIIVAIDHVGDPATAGNFTSLVQGGGYFLASFAPLLAGAVRYSTGNCKRFSTMLRSVSLDRSLRVAG
ncbi:hypothetical protein [Leisingera sp.]|uniref:hypothetical protein n=1 Tax=Leisingera sp. TaxID=1879318 RepID=UPI002B269E54|nr:hypothetical protein [Leisingera sp.]